MRPVRGLRDFNSNEEQGGTISKGIEHLLSHPRLTGTKRQSMPRISRSKPLCFLGSLGTRSGTVNGRFGPRHSLPVRFHVLSANESQAFVSLTISLPKADLRLCVLPTTIHGVLRV